MVSAPRAPKASARAPTESLVAPVRAIVLVFVGVGALGGIVTISFGVGVGSADCGPEGSPDCGPSPGVGRGAPSRSSRTPGLSSGISGSGSGSGGIVTEIGAEPRLIAPRASVTVTLAVSVKSAAKVC